MILQTGHKDLRLCGFYFFQGKLSEGNYDTKTKL
jgi:hypothetical protein